MRISDWSSDVCSSDLPPDKTAGEAVLAVPGWSAQRVAFVVGGSVSAPPPALVDGGAGPTTPPRDTSVPQTHLATNDVAAGNAFLPNLSAYAPIFAAYGPGTNSDARLQIRDRKRTRLNTSH